MLLFHIDKMLFTIPAEQHDIREITEILEKHPEVQFVSFVGIDIGGHDTDEKIPVALFIENMEDMLVRIDNIVHVMKYLSKIRMLSFFLLIKKPNII